MGKDALRFTAEFTPFLIDSCVIRGLNNNNDNNNNYYYFYYFIGFIGNQVKIELNEQEWLK